MIITCTRLYLYNLRFLNFIAYAEKTRIKFILLILTKLINKQNFFKFEIKSKPTKVRN